MKRKTKVAIIFLLLLAVGASIAFENYQEKHAPYKLLADNDLGTVERITIGCETSGDTIAIITGIHPKEKLSIDPVIQAAREYVSQHKDIKIIHYQVNVTKDAKKYDKGKANGEKLAHDFVNPDVTKSDASCVIISHSHNGKYGDGFYLTTPEMDKSSVGIAKKIKATSDFGYYPKTGDDKNSTSDQLVSCPIAEAGYPTFTYEIPKDTDAEDAVEWTKDLFRLMVKYAC